MNQKEVRFEDLVKVSEFVYEIPQSFREDMRVAARVFATENMLKDILTDKSLQQLVNVATLPGIVECAYAMPDIHQGYGFPIGGVAGTDIQEGGVISPGGIGYDINCGVRLLTTDVNVGTIQPYLEKLATLLFDFVPSGVGKGGVLKLSDVQMDEVLRNGAHQMLKMGYGNELDLTFCEELGKMDNANPDLISDHAKKRGFGQLGTLGSGNHFLEVQKVDEIFDEEAAQVFGLYKGQVVVMIHCGSRGLGHQTCTDHVKIMNQAKHQWNYELPDRELICAPFNSKEGQDYFAAMAAASNYAWANRHMITHSVRQAFIEVFGDECGVRTMYDISHNIGKVEIHNIHGVEKKLVMHRKGATRSFGPGRNEISQAYRHIGQPVLIPGTMGTASYVLAGTEKSMQVALGSSCHGAGRTLSRAKAKRTVRGSELRKKLESQGIIIQSDSDPGLAEEAPIAYKDVHEVIDVVSGVGLAKKVVRLKPLAVVKGG